MAQKLDEYSKAPSGQLLDEIASLVYNNKGGALACMALAKV